MVPRTGNPDTWAENDGRGPSNDLTLHQTAGKSPKKLPPKENPEGYGLQPVHKCIHTNPALAAEGGVFPSIHRHHKTTPQYMILFVTPYTRSESQSPELKLR